MTATVERKEVASTPPTPVQVLAQIVHDKMLCTYRRFHGAQVPCYACELQGVPFEECEHQPNWNEHVSEIYRRGGFEDWGHGESVDAPLMCGAEDFNIILRHNPEIRIRASKQGCPGVMRAEIQFRKHYSGHWQTLRGYGDHAELTFICDHIIACWPDMDAA